jgi:sugar fermentation stimulation protein A
MNFLAEGPLVPATIVRRDNRFRAAVQVAGVAQAAHVPNSGRLRELLLPGAPAYLRRAQRPRRVTPYDLTLVRAGAELVCIDARLPPKLIAEAWRAGRLPWLQAYDGVRSEVRWGHSRLDLLFGALNGRSLWVETKCVTLVQDGTARFPDAPTARGRRHVQELTMLAAAGEQAAIVFVVQRADCNAFAPNDLTDPAFGEAMRAAAAAGVVLQAYRCLVSESEITLADSIPVQL